MRSVTAEHLKKDLKKKKRCSSVGPTRRRARILRGVIARGERLVSARASMVNEVPITLQR